MGIAASANRHLKSNNTPGQYRFIERCMDFYPLCPNENYWIALA
jgi:hypothetical protein